jgi:hypothetical protein
MWPAFPVSDYYGGSASLHIIGGTLPWHLCKPSPVHMLDSIARARLPVAVFILAFRKSSQISRPSCALSVMPCWSAYISGQHSRRRSVHVTDADPRPAC